MRYTSLIALLVVSGCRSYEWHPQRARFAELRPVTTEAVRVYEGDLNTLASCDERFWLGDVVCEPDCGDIRGWAADRGATHVWLVATRRAVRGRAVTSRWQDYRLFHVPRRLQLDCLPLELQSR